MSSEPEVVLLHIETASKREARALQGIVLLLEVFLVVFCILILLKDLGSDSAHENHKVETYLWFNIILGSVILGAALLRISLSVYRLYHSRSKDGVKKHWSKRRKYMATEALIQLALTVIIFGVWVSGYALTLKDPCGVSYKALLTFNWIKWVSTALFMMWMMFMMANMRLRKHMFKDGLPSNIGELDSILLCDAPLKEKLKMNGPAIVLFFLLSIIATGGYARNINVGGHMSAYNTCPIPTTCPTHTEDLSTLIFRVITLCVLLGLYIWYWQTAKADLNKLPYCHYRLETMYVRVQARFGIMVLASLLMVVLIVDGGNFGNCSIYVSRVLGPFPVPLSLALYALASAYLFLPSDNKNTFTQAVLQSFAWTHASEPEAIEKRNLLLPGGSDGPSINRRSLARAVTNLANDFKKVTNFLKDDPKKLRHQPMFCMETAIRLYYWARLAYQYGTEGTIMSEDYALSLFNLKHFECLHDEGTDTRMVMGWSDDTLVLSFRGTASTKNVWTDLKAWSMSYPGNKGWRHALTVRVHTGFYSAWSGNDFNKKLLEKVNAIIQASPSIAGMQVFVTGHSLGGALATLGALEVKKENIAAQVKCYTFGAPRVGNRPFAGMYNKAVPDTWHIVNEDDPVARIPKFVYKHGGNKVIVTSRGDIIVKPSFFEMAVVTSGGVVKHHMMGAYAVALGSIIRSQFFPHKALVGGESNAKELLGAVDVGSTLMITPFDPEKVSNPSQSFKLRAQVSSIDRDALSRAMSRSRTQPMPDMDEENEFMDCDDDGNESITDKDDDKVLNKTYTV